MLAQAPNLLRAGGARARGVKCTFSDWQRWVCWPTGALSWQQASRSAVISHWAPDIGLLAGHEAEQRGQAGTHERLLLRRSDTLVVSAKRLRCREAGVQASSITTRQLRLRPGDWFSTCFRLRSGPRCASSSRCIASNDASLTDLQARLHQTSWRAN